jgi:predicted DNA-binding transcriptional regulator YafY
MRRADRLFRLVQLVRGRRLSTAAWLAQRLEVSLRTVYRDIADLQAQGVPLEGEAGVGYRMAHGFDLPPLMFTIPEAQALVAAARLAAPRLGPVLGEAADSALAKILSVLPAAERARAQATPIFAPALDADPHGPTLDALRRACEERCKLALTYRDLDDRLSVRTVRPLACLYWGQVWTLAAWCELRADFRSFRVDRIAAMQVLAERFRDEPGRTLPDLFRAHGRELP